MDILKAEDTVWKLKKWNVNLKVDIKNGSVIGIAKSITIPSDQLLDLAGVAAGQTVTFSRTGANFRIIIS